MYPVKQCLLAFPCYEWKSSGGDTLFADMYQAFETLSSSMQTYLKQLHARHDPKGHYLYLSGAKKLDGGTQVGGSTLTSAQLPGPLSICLGTWPIKQQWRPFAKPSHHRHDAARAQ